MTLESAIRAQALALGFDACRFASASADPKWGERLRAWLETGAEGDMDWIPGALQTADMIYEAYAHELQPKIQHPPRHYWENNLHATFINDRAGLRLIDEIGQIPGITRIETSVILSTKLDRR